MAVRTPNHLYLNDEDICTLGLMWRDGWVVSDAHGEPHAAPVTATDHAFFSSLLLHRSVVTTHVREEGKREKKDVHGFLIYIYDLGDGGENSHEVSPYERTLRSS